MVRSGAGGGGTLINVIKNFEKYCDMMVISQFGFF